MAADLIADNWDTAVLPHELAILGKNVMNHRDDVAAFNRLVEFKVNKHTLAPRFVLDMFKATSSGF